jgi:tyrosyl-DNA phosphodiesterase 2
MTDSLALATWNIWFGELAWRQRLDALLHEVWLAAPDVIGLQEVTHFALEELLATSWLTERYALSDTTGETIDGYGVLLAVRRPLLVGRFAWLDLPTGFGRRLVSAPIEVGRTRLRIGTVHLESMRPNASLREEQLNLILPHLAAESPALLMGDFNFDPSMDEERLLTAPWRDLWAECRPEDPGLTRDSTINRMVALHQGEDKHRRIDRIIGCGALTTDTIQLLGTGHLNNDPDLFPSDHFGLLARVSL